MKIIVHHKTCHENGVTLILGIPVHTQLPETATLCVWVEGFDVIFRPGRQCFDE